MEGILGQQKHDVVASLSRSNDACRVCGHLGLVSTFRWHPIILAYCLYALLTFIGYVTGIDLQVLGALSFLGFLFLQYGRFFFPLHLNWLTLMVLLSSVLPLIAFLSGVTKSDDSTLTYVVKYYAIYLLILLCANLRMAPIFRTKWRWWAWTTLLGILLIGLLFSHPFTSGGITRLQGVFANPNNFALVAMSLLFFLDEQRDSLRLKVLVNIVVLSLIVLSGTSGAILGYVGGMLYRMLHLRWGRIILLSVVLLLALSASVILHLANQQTNGVGALGSLITKIHVIQHNSDLLNSQAATVNYWDIDQKEANGERGATSALWRLIHWRDMMTMFVHGAWSSILFGNGIGSSSVLSGAMAHNDYLRLLFENGILGLISTLGVWGLFFARSAPGNAGCSSPWRSMPFRKIISITTSSCVYSSFSSPVRVRQSFFPYQRKRGK